MTISQKWAIFANKLLIMTLEIKQAVEVLRQGGVILYPTDTIWGLGCDATCESAVHRIFEIKRRADSKSMLVLVDSEAKLQGYVQEIPDMAWDLMEFSEKPITIIYPQAKNLAKNLIAEDGSVGIRVTKEVFSKRLCEAFRRPIVSTSANVSGVASPSCFSDISSEIRDAVDYVVPLRQEEQMALPSSIIKLEVNGEIKIIRA